MAVTASDQVPANIQEKLKLLPAKPGVYLMKTKATRLSTWARPCRPQSGALLFPIRPPQLSQSGGLG